MASTTVIALAVSCGGSPAVSADGDEHEAGAGGAAPAGGAAQSGSSATGNGVVGFGGFASMGSGGERPDEGCATGVAEAELVPANFLFVIDQSGSMNCNPPDGDATLAARCARFPTKEDPSRPSKWEVTRDALVAVLEGLSGRPKLSAGLMLFPRESECGVSSEPSVPIAALDAEHVGVIRAALDAAEPDGETPVGGATILSYAHLADRLVKGELSGNSFVVLLTDGMETCAPSVLEPLVGEHVPNARGFDIRTFVIGAPGSEPARALLSEVAFQGETSTSASCEHGGDRAESGDCHFDMTGSEDFAAELVAALSAISSTETLSCEIDVPKSQNGSGVDLNRVNVTFTPESGEVESIPRDDGACDASADGWQYSADFRKIVLCGGACSRVRDNDGELEIVLGCRTDVR